MPRADFDPADPEAQHTLRALAEEAARAGGHVARQYFRTDLAVRLKSDRSEVSDADEAAQAAVVAHIRAARPADAFIAEERLDLPDPPSPPANDRLCWAIDPLDGTRNFIRQVPLYTCSVAAMIGGVPLVGAVYDPVHDVLYSAGREEGLFVNGELQPARRGPARPPGANPKPVVAIPSAATGPTARLAHAWLDRYLCRSLGSTALHMAMVATGQFDGMIGDEPRLWDIAAGWVLVIASGGQVTGPAGQPIFPLDVRTYAGEGIPTLAFGTGVSLPA